MRVHWEEVGRGHPRTLLLVHGLGQSSLAWSEVVPSLGRRHHTVTLDLPGFGRSEPPSKRPYLDSYVTAVREVLEHVAGPRRAVLVGHSLGAGVAARVAFAEPERLAGLVLIDAAGAGTSVPAWWRLAALQGPMMLASAPFLRLATGLPMEAGIGFFYRFAGFANPLLPRRELVSRLASQLSDPDRLRRFLATAHDVVESFVRHPIRPPRDWSLPTLVLWGRQDRLISWREGRALARRLGPSARLALVDRCGHSPQLERPDRVLARLDAFLEELPA
jgi:pimeloyl-ACP methyl ester carboxylesterase